jgi:outer membrane protein OmpA-like peptidoglycan-associated protein
MFRKKGTLYRAIAHYDKQVRSGACTMKIHNNLTVFMRLALVIFIFSIGFASIGLTDSDFENRRRIFVGTNVRALGMGSAFTAGPSASDSNFWNPSALGFLKGAEASLVGLPFSETAGNREGAFSFALNPHELGIARENIGNMSISSWFDGWGNDDELNRLMMVGYGLSLGREVATGATIRHHRRNSSLRTQLGWSFDLGLSFSRKLPRVGRQIAFGLAFEDLGGHFWENGRLVEKMAPVTRLGTTYHLDNNTIFSGDIVLHNDKQHNWQDRFRTHLGAERWLFNNRLGLRIGYTGIANYDRFTEGEWSRGFGVRSESGQLDYAYVNGNELDQGIHWISATIRWGGTNKTPVPQSPIATATEVKPTELTEPTQILMPQQIQTSLRISEEAISPNGDGVRDLAVFDIDVTGDTAWQLEIRDEFRELVQTYSGTGKPMKAVEWDGKDVHGNLARDGRYTVQLIYSDEAGNRLPQRKMTVIVDTIPAALKVSAEPLILSTQAGTHPHDEFASNDLVVNVPTVHVQASDLNPIGHWELQFFNDTGSAIDQIKGEGDPPNTMVWNNWRQHELPTGADPQYRCGLTVHDFAGNRATHETTFAFIDLKGGLDQRQATDEHNVKRELVLTMPELAFDSNSFEINDESRPSLERVVEALGANPLARAVIEGHTDDRGDAGYNRELSRKRANAVMTYLVDEFSIQPSRLSAIGYGEERPITDNDTETNQQKNRRVEIVVLKDEADSQEQVNAQVSSTQPATQQTPKEAIEAESAYPPRYTLLVSSFKSRGNAQVLVELLEALDLGEAVRLAPVMIQSEQWYRVTVGQFSDKADAAELIDQIKASHELEPLIITDTG